MSETNVIPKCDSKIEWGMLNQVNIFKYMKLSYIRWIVRNREQDQNKSYKSRISEKEKQSNVASQILCIECPKESIKMFYGVLYDSICWNVNEQIQKNLSHGWQIWTSLLSLYGDLHPIRKLIWKDNYCRVVGGILSGSFKEVGPGDPQVSARHWLGGNRDVVYEMNDVNAIHYKHFPVRSL